jgi:hypothetical protein
LVLVRVGVGDPVAVKVGLEVPVEDPVAVMVGKEVLVEDPVAVEVAGGGVWVPVRVKVSVRVAVGVKVNGVGVEDGVTARGVSVLVGVRVQGTIPGCPGRVIFLPQACSPIVRVTSRSRAFTFMAFPRGVLGSVL